MTPQEEIQSYLDSEEKSFQDGYGLFVKYSRNRSMMLYLGRKQNLDKLNYELKKLLPFALKANSVKVIKPISRVMDEDHASEMKTQFQINRFEKVDAEKLPEDQKKIHSEIAESYKLQRTFHEKMKLASTDEERARMRNEVIRLDDFIKKAWKGLDAFVKSGETVPEKAKAKNVLEMSKEINACRSYLSRGISDLANLKDAKKSKRVNEMKKRIEKLISLKASVKKETREALINLKIIDGKSNLQGE